MENINSWPFVTVLLRMGLAVVLGIFIGLERQHNQKTGVRTFALVALMGCLGGFMGNLFAGITVGLVALLVVGMNYREIMHRKNIMLTTSVALIIVGIAGVLIGQGHVFAPATAVIITATLLAWKQPLSKFALGLSVQELRSAILLAILTVVILPVLPDHPVDPWGLVEPRSNWISVVIIAAIGFINYILMRLLGPRGAEVTAFFGGLINSRKVIVELCLRLQHAGQTLMSVAQRGILLATAAMLIRNAVIVAVLSPMMIVYCIFPLLAMLVVNLFLWWRTSTPKTCESQSSPLILKLPFQLSTSLKFGAVFLLLNVVGALAERNFGPASFYFVSISGGLLSSASAIASAATLVAHHQLTLLTGVNGIILSSLTSILANIPLIRGLVHESGLKRRMLVLLIIITVIGLAAGTVNHIFLTLHPPAN